MYYVTTDIAKQSTFRFPRARLNLIQKDMETFSHIPQTWDSHLDDEISSARMPASLADILLNISSIGMQLNECIREYGIDPALTGLSDKLNIHEEAIKKINLYAHELFCRSLSMNPNCAAIVSAEEAQPIQTSFHTGDYIVYIHPLDSSSNIDIHTSTGSVFSIYKNTWKKNPLSPMPVERGKFQVAAGYILYSSTTLLVYTNGNGTHGFTLSNKTNQYYLTHPNINTPERSSIYLINEGNPDAHSSCSSINQYLQYCKSKYSSNPSHLRYTGSTVADMHFTLLNGGIFLYPITDIYPSGKLKLMYECNPFAFLIQQANGKAINEHGIHIMEIYPEHIHQRSSIMIGSKVMVENLEDTCMSYIRSEKCNTKKP
jgi:fructose-1,6-bisphosphatase I